MSIVVKRLLSFSFVLLFIACTSDTSTEIDGLPYDLQEIKDQYLSLWTNSTEKEGFLFFTDPHLLGYDNEFDNSMQASIHDTFVSVKTLFDMLPFSFCLCGGDWLNNSDTQTIAINKLLFADNLMKSMFKPYYKMLGNHDTNYQGIVTKDDHSRGDLSRVFVDKVYFQETGAAYYSFRTETTEFYILDSGLDWTTELDDYRMEQLIWLSKQLCQSVFAHKVIGIHMFFNSPNITPMAKEIALITEAFNTRNKYKLVDKEFDFSDSYGKIHFILTGHRHVDFVENVNGIPVVGTCKFLMDGKSSYDICLLDYDRGYLEMIRVGEGENRHIKMNM